MKIIPPGHEAVMAAIEAAASSCHIEHPSRLRDLPAAPVSEFAKAIVEGLPTERGANVPVERCQAVFS